MDKDKIKLFLSNKLNECEAKIKEVKRKRRIVKIIYGTTIIISISVSTVTAAVSGSFALPLLPTIIITSLSTVGATCISTAISTKFKLRSKKTELNIMITRLDRLKQQINYVVTCNGDLTEHELKNIMKEFL